MIERKSKFVLVINKLFLYKYFSLSCLPTAAKQENSLMKAWLGLVNERNGLVRKTSELTLRMKELELEDRQYEIDQKLSALSSLPGTWLALVICAKFQIFEFFNLFLCVFFFVFFCKPLKVKFEGIIYYFVGTP